MDTEAFLLARQSLRFRLEAARDVALPPASAKNYLMMGFPLAGFLAAQSIDGKKHPIMRSFIMAGITRLASRLALQWGIDKFTEPAGLKRLFSLV